MRLKVDLDDDLVADAVQVSGIRDLTALIREALQALLAKHRRKSLLDLQGKIEFASGYDYKRIR